VDDGEADAFGVALGPAGSDARLLEVADGDEAVQPLTAISNAAPARTPANRWVAIPRLITSWFGP
jgi:hypothetical protein